MKNLVLPLALVIIIGACSSKKKSSASSAPAAPPVSAVPAPPAPPSAPVLIATNPNEVNEKLLEVAKTKYPDASIETLTKGHELYFGTCIRCHAARPISVIPKERWPMIIENMARQARITDVEKQAVLQYVTAVSLNK